jgi:hypothetical protein
VTARLAPAGRTSDGHEGACDGRSANTQRLEPAYGDAAEAQAAGVKPLPLWLAGDHFPFTLGSVNGRDQRVVAMDTGGAGGNALAMSESMAKSLKVRMDYDRPTSVNRIPAFPCYPDEARIGSAVAKGVYSIARTDAAAYERLGFDPIANFTHAYFKPFSLTFDFTGMQFYISRPA